VRHSIPKKRFRSRQEGTCCIRALHWDGTRDEEAVIQITGYGPSGNKFLKAGEPPFAQEK
jgi:hypothetical protein